MGSSLAVKVTSMLFADGGDGQIAVRAIFAQQQFKSVGGQYAWGMRHGGLLNGFELLS
jgi:hypothetical protein